MCHTQGLGLGGNQIGDAGLTALAKAVESGALASCQKLYLSANKIGEVGLSAFASACASGALPALQELELHTNRIGDAGMSAFASACASGALDHLMVCLCSTTLSPCPETWHTHSPDSYVLFDVPYAGAWSRR
jgi:hypothetical protein